MPEGDTVYRAAKVLRLALQGAVLTRCDIRVPAFATVDLTGERVDAVLSRGKHLLMRIGELTIHSHLKMEGSWEVYAAGAPWRKQAWQARAILGTAQHTAVGFQLGQLEVLRRSDEAAALDYLGPDLLGPDWDPEVAIANLERDPGRAIGLALLDQRNLAGLGNVYRNELCFLRGVAPTVPSGSVQLEPMVMLAKRLIEANKDRAQRTTTGNLRGQTTWVYGRAGQPCSRCGTRILHDQIGDSPLELRSIFWCPKCQP
jgi:endonuclease-8